MADPSTSPATRRTPPLSRASSASSRAHKPNLSLDLSDIPSLIRPSPPSNTLLVTNLQNPAIFAPTTLAHLHDLIVKHSPDGIHNFAPLRSLRRIVISFPTVESAVAVRSVLDGEALYGDRVRVYFGEPTPIRPLADRHLQAPKASKQFFISPPPSPPHGWQSKEEDPPNKDVVAEDLATALERLSARREVDADVDTSSAMQGVVRTGARQRSGSSTILYAPEEHGHSPDLPAIAVEDTTMTPDELSPNDADVDGEHKKIFAHTSRPPVELMS